MSTIYSVYSADRQQLLAAGPTKTAAFNIAFLLHQRFERANGRTPLTEDDFRKRIVITRKPKDG